jgi:hypothetical protein
MTGMTGIVAAAVTPGPNPAGVQAAVRAWASTAPPRWVVSTVVAESRYEGNRYDDNRYDNSRYDDSRYNGSRYDQSRYDESRYDELRDDNGSVDSYRDTYRDNGFDSGFDNRVDRNFDDRRPRRTAAAAGTPRQDPFEGDPWGED